MAVIGIYAGSSKDGMTILPSPISLKPSQEMIWSENTGRAQSGTNKAKMIGDVVAQKQTYAIQWGIITQTEYNAIKAKLTPGFFWFGVGTSISAAKSAAGKYYRSEISGEMIQAGAEIRYKNVSCNVIEQ